MKHERLTSRMQVRINTLGTRLTVMALVAGLLLGLGACATPERINVAATLMEATNVFRSARDGGARDKAPFEYYSAELYLEQARQLHAFGRTEESAFLASHALQFAREALYLTERFRPAVNE